MYNYWFNPYMASMMQPPFEQPRRRRRRQPDSPPFGPGMPPFGFPPFGTPPFGPGTDGRLDGPPTSPPPSFTPSLVPTPRAVDPGAITRCRRRFTYIWLENGDSFWFYPIFVGRRSIAGFRWIGFWWIYYGVDLRNIRSFTCF